MSQCHSYQTFIGRIVEISYKLLNGQLKETKQSIVVVDSGWHIGLKSAKLRFILKLMAGLKIFQSHATKKINRLG